MPQQHQLTLEVDTKVLGKSGSRIGGRSGYVFELTEEPGTLYALLKTTSSAEKWRTRIRLLLSRRNPPCSRNDEFHRRGTSRLELCVSDGRRGTVLSIAVRSVNDILGLMEFSTTSTWDDHGSTRRASVFSRLALIASTLASGFFWSEAGVPS